MKLPPGSYLPAACVAALALAPILVLIDLAAGADVLVGSQHLSLLINTIILMLGTALGALLIGVPLAFLLAFVRLPLARLWLVLLAAPLAMPSYIGAFTFYAVFGRGAELEQWIGLETPSASGMLGACIVMALYTYPFVMLSTRAALLSQDANLINAARILGLPLLQAMLRVALPRALHGVAAGALLAALYALSDFGTPAILNVDTFTRLIYVEYNAFGLSQAAVFSLHLLALVGLVVFIESRFSGMEERAGRSLTLHPGPLAQTVTLLSVLPIIALSLLLPLVLFSVWLVREGLASFDATVAVNSVVAALLAAAVAVLFALPVAVAAGRGRIGWLLERVTYLGFGIPGIVMGTALVYLGLKLPALYQTLVVLVLALVLRFLPLAVGALRGAIEQLDTSLYKAGRVLGAGPIELFTRLTVPLTARGVFAGAALVFLEAMRELPATLLLAPTGFETLATYLWRVYEAGLFGRAAIPGLLLVCLSGLGLALMLAGERRADTMPGSTGAEPC
ncbi:MAG: iron ABC transporter permease [Pseudomonadota bacterium]